MFPIAAAFLVACLVLGGGTRPGFAGDAILQMLAIPVILLLILRSRLSDLPGSARGALLVCCLLAAIPLGQLIPLPVSWTSGLGAHRAAQEVWSLSGHASNFVPISVATAITAQSALSLLPPLAVFLTTLTLGFSDRRRLSIVLVSTGVVSVALGLVQLAQGPQSPLRLFETTNNFEAVGFFANRNHFAALCFTLLTMLAAWISVLQPDKRRGAHSARLPSPLTAMPQTPVLAAALLMAVTLMIGEIAARSRAGILLTIVAIVLSTIAFFRRKFSTQSRAAMWGSVALFVLTVAIIGQNSVLRAIDRFASDPLSDGRLPFARNTLAAAADNPVLGTGMGTFPLVYGAYSKLADEIPYLFANRAHNDYLELYLESGFAGIAVLAIFVAGVGWLAHTLWADTWPETRLIDLALARSGFIIVLLLGAHSLVDYPLRTAALASVLAFACGLMIRPAIGVGDPQERPRQR